MSNRIDHEDVLSAAYALLGDGQGGEWEKNPEYTRGVVELTTDLLGYCSPDDHDIVEGAIRAVGLDV